LQQGQQPQRGFPLEQTTLYERVGREPFFVELIARFYEGVEKDPVLRPLYPEDLEPSKAHLAGFLSQYWGGPRQYSMERGHPRLRMRHAPFAIGQRERDAWVVCMAAAVEAVDVSPQDAALLMTYFNDTATFLMNRT
jgi:hemoglobin